MLKVYSVTCSLFLINFIVVNCQQDGGGSTPTTPNSNANCTRFYRSIQRAGQFISGQVTIPMSTLREDEAGSMGFKLQMKFNRAVRAVYVRQVVGRDMAGTSHTEFMMDTTAKEGKMRINTLVRLMGFFGPPPRVTRIVFNNKALCGAPLTQTETNESIIVNSVVSKTLTTTISPSDLFKVQPDNEDDYY